MTLATRQFRAESSLAVSVAINRTQFKSVALTELDLTNCAIGDDQLSALFGVMPSLVSLSLAGNELTDNSVAMIKELLLCAPDLRDFDGNDNRFSSRCVARLVDLTSRLRLLRHCTIGDQTMNSLLRARTQSMAAAYDVNVSLNDAQLRNFMTTMRGAVDLT